MGLIFLDTETTGVGEDDRLVEIAYKVEGKKPHSHFFKPPKSISIDAMATHHITNEMVSKKVPFASSKLRDKIEKLVKENIVVAHNARFDIRMLENEGVEARFFIDTLRVCKHMIPDKDSFALQNLRYSLGLYKDIEKESVAHSAAGDIIVLEHLFNYLRSLVRFNMNEKEEQAHDDVEKAILLKMIDLTNTPAPMYKIGFGKHRGKPFHILAKTEMDYLRWLYNAETAKPVVEQNEDLIFTLKQYV